MVLDAIGKELRARGFARTSAQCFDKAITDDVAGWVLTMLWRVEN